MINITQGTCIECGSGFTYVRYKVDKNYCSNKCKNRHYYVARGTYSERQRRQKMSPEQWKEHKRNYDRAYIQQPEIREKRNERFRRRYRTPEYRDYMRRRYYASVGEPLATLNHGYTGHRWLDLARRYVGEPPAENSVYFDSWADRMGEAVLALLEGRDIQEAIREHNRREYIPNNRTIFMGDWKSDEERSPEEYYFPSSESAEEEAIAKETVSYEVKARYSHGSNRRRFGTAGSHRGRTQPSRRAGFKPHQDRPGNRR